MSVPDYIDVETLCLRSLRQSGQQIPSGPMIQECRNIQFQDVKSDFQFAAPDHRLLLTRAGAATVRGLRQYPQPADLHLMQQILLLDGPDDWRGTFTSSTALASTLNVDEGVMTGKTLFLTGGTGALQWRTIIDWDNVLNVPMLDSAWSVTPDTTTTYLIVDRQTPIFNASKTYSLDLNNYPSTLSCPTRAANFGEEVWIEQAPDKVYGLQYEYYADVSSIDEDGLVMKKLLREKFGLFMQGLIAKNMRLFDDDRVVNNERRYEQYLNALASEARSIGRTVPFG